MQEGEEWHEDRPLVAMDVIDQSLVDTLVRIVREIWCHLPSDVISDREAPIDLPDRDLEILYRIVYRH